MTPAGSPAALPGAAYAAALAGLEGMSPGSLRTLLSSADPAGAWEEVRAGCAADRAGGWRRAAEDLDVGIGWGRMEAAGIGALWVGDDLYPAGMDRDPHAPAVLFTKGDPAKASGHPRVALVGTRSPTRYGLGVAAQLGAELSGAGVSVMSGLGIGIDGAAHEGACAGFDAGGPDAGPPIGVVAGGLDVVHPARHEHLWERVAARGVIVSEAPPGRRCLPWRFPRRNALVAALADVVVVVESHDTGVALHTVRAAAALGVPVGAVPGSIRSPASAGTNALLADGCFPVRDLHDVLVALSLAGAVPPRRPLGPAVLPPGPQRPGAPSAADRLGAAPAAAAGAAAGAGAGAGAGRAEEAAEEAPRGVPDRRSPGSWALSPAASRVLAAVDFGPTSLEAMLGRTSLALGELSVELERLASLGLVDGEGGYWERT